MQADGKNLYIKLGDNRDIVANIIKYYELWRNQPQKLVSGIYNLDVEEQCYAIFCYVLNNVAYKEDRAGYQFIKSPARLLKDGIGDCKSMTIFVASCLYCLGIPHKIRFVNFDGGDQYTHVYAVAIDRGREIIIDCVERDAQGQPIFNYAREYAKKIDISYLL